MAEAARKVIPLPTERGNRSLGRDELNICEFPLSVCGRADNSVKTLTFEDEVFDEGAGKQVHRRLVVSASDAFGLPTPSDTDVLLVLLHLTNQRSAFMERTVKFTRYELVKLLGWDDGGKSYKRLEGALNRWASVTLYYNHAWWDKEGKAWRSRTFHVLESVDLRGREGTRDASLSSFSWNPVLFQSFQANHLKRIDLDAYFSLNSPAARQAYRFLDKRFYKKTRLTFDLRSFACEHIGLSRNYDNGNLKRKLKCALRELEEQGFLEPMSDKERYSKETRGKWNITLVKKTTADGDATEHDGTSLFSELVRRGITEKAAGEFVEQFDHEKVREKIAFHDALLSDNRSRPPKNPAGYLAASIREDWAVRVAAEKGPGTKMRRTSSIADRRTDETAQVEAERDSRFNRYWQGLSKSKRDAIEKRAIDDMGKLQLDTYRRLEKKGGPLFEEMRLSAIRNYVQSAR